MNSIFFNDLQLTENSHRSTVIPPQVPRYWVFSHFTITGATGNALRVQLFAKLRKLNVDISSTIYSWKYRLQFCEGPALLDIDCFFFQRESDVIVDINLLSGDRWTWHRLKADVNNDVSIPRLISSPLKTAGFVSERLRRGEFADSDFQWLSDDIPVEWWLPYLKSKDLNIVRQSMEKLCLLKYAGHNSEIEKWKALNPASFIEREIKKHALKIGHIRSLM